MRYQDMMDSSRTVQVVKQKDAGKDGRNMNVKVCVCKVFFDGKYSGETEIPLSLFEMRWDPRLKREVPLSYGFGPDGCLDREKMKPARAPRRERHDEEDWN